MRRLALCLALSFGLMAWLPAFTRAETVSIGEVAPAGTAGFCLSCSFLQVQTDPLSPSYTVPAGDWTVTSWSIMSGTTTDGFDRLRIWRNLGGGVYQLVAESADESVMAAPGGSLRTFSANIPVQGGDLLGVTTGNPSGDTVGTYMTANAGDVFGGVMGFPSLGQTAGPGGDYPLNTNGPFRINAQATLTRPDPLPPTAPATTPSQPTQGVKKKCKKRKRGKRTAAAAKRCKRKKKKGR